MPARSPRKAVWKLEDAKARFSEVVREAQKKPQTVTVHGEEKVVVLSMEEYCKRRPAESEMTPLEFFQSLDFRGLDVKRDRRPATRPDVVDLLDLR